MGFAEEIKYNPKRIAINFQFPLWDSTLKYIQERSENPQFFQFPLWDSE